MNHRISIAAAVLVLTSCGSPLSPIKVGPAFPITFGGTVGLCALASTTEQIGGGSVDLSGNPEYLLALGISSDLNPAFTTTNIQNGQGQDLQAADDNDFIATQIRYSYTSQPPIGLAAETDTFHMVIPAGAVGTTGNNFVVMDALGPQATAKLFAANQPVNVVSTIQFSGQLRSGSSMQSDVISFPIAVFESGFTCAGAHAPNGPCGLAGGQDGSPPLCCVVTDGGTKPNGCP